MTTIQLASGQVFQVRESVGDVRRKLNGAGESFAVLTGAQQNTVVGDQIVDDGQQIHVNPAQVSFFT